MTMLCSSATQKDVQRTTMQYLLDLTKPKTTPAERCASLCILMDIFKADTSEDNRTYCITNGLLDTIQEILLLASQTDKNAITILQFTCAVKIVWQISILQHSVAREVASDVLLEQLLDLFQPKGYFYDYPTACSDKLKDSCKNKYLVGRCIPMKLTVDNFNHLKNHQFFDRYFDIPKKLYECQLFDTSGENDVNISNHLIALKLAWPGDLDQIDQSDSTSDTWNDIFVTEVFVGNIFWAQVGESAITKSKNIQSILCSNKATLYAHSCKIGDLVAVVTNPSDDGCYRAKVISFALGRVRVFAVDFGFTELVDKNQVFALPVMAGILEFPMQASLCFLSGVQPPPIDVCVIQAAASAVANFVRFNIKSGKNLVRFGAPNNFLPMLNCPEPTIVIQLMRVISNLSHNPALHKPVIFSHTLVAVLRLCKNLLEDAVMEKKVKCWIVEASLTFLTNVLQISYEYRNEFQNKQGLDIVLKFAAQTFRFSRVYKLCLQLLRNFVSTAGEQLVSNFKQTTNTESTQDIPVCTAETKESASLQCLHSSYSDDEEEEEYFKQILVRKQTTSPGRLATITQEVIHKSNSVIAVNSAAVHNDPDNSYIYGSEVEFYDDAIHELRPNRNFFEVSSNLVIAIVCSMLNSGRSCTIYFGIGKDRRVHGMQLYRENRDEFRLSLDKMMNGLRPQVMYFQYDLVYMPVVKSSDEDETQNLVPIDNLYVAEIRLRSNTSTMYTRNGFCYYRFGASTTQLSPREVRQLATLAEEETYKEEILQLRRELSSLDEST